MAEYKKHKTETSESASSSWLYGSQSVKASVTNLCSAFNKTFRVAIPVVVTKYIRKTHHVLVRPIIKFAFTNNSGALDYLDYNSFEVPINYQEHGGFALDWPYYVGDTGWVISSDQDFMKKHAVRMPLLKDLEEKEIETFTMPAETSSVHSLGGGVFFSDSWVFRASMTKDEAILKGRISKTYNDIQKSDEYITDDSPILSFTSFIGEDDDFSEYHKRYLAKNTSGIYIEEGYITLATEGKYTLRDKKHFTISYNKIAIDYAGVSAKSIQEKKEGDKYEIRTTSMSVGNASNIKVSNEIVKKKLEDTTDEKNTSVMVSGSNGGSVGFRFTHSNHTDIGKDSERTYSSEASIYLGYVTCINKEVTKSKDNTSTFEANAASSRTGISLDIINYDKDKQTQNKIKQNRCLTQIEPGRFYSYHNEQEYKTGTACREYVEAYSDFHTGMVDVDVYAKNRSCNLKVNGNTITTKEEFSASGIESCTVNGSVKLSGEVYCPGWCTKKEHKH